MEEQEIAAAIGWMLVASGALAVVLSSVFPRFGCRSTSAGLILGGLGLFIAGHTWGSCGRTGTDAGPVRLLSLSALHDLTAQIRQPTA
jgi:hypothetical protein